MSVNQDTIQLVREAVVEALDELPAIVALTGRASGNVVPFKNRDKAKRPVIAYLVVMGKQMGGTGNTWRVTLQLSGIADDDDDATANALVWEVEKRLTPPVLAALLLSPIDAYVEPGSITRRGVGEDLFARADIDITLVVTN